MKARLIDIAAQAHVSEATVSRVLAGKPGVNSATREKVLQIARELGRYSDAALQDSRPLIGVVLPVLDNPIFPMFADAVEQEAARADADVLIGAGARSPEDEERIFDRLVRAGSRGIIVVSGLHADSAHSHDHYRAAMERGVAFSLVNGELPDLQAAFITADDEFAISLALTHLRELGHERIGLAVGDEHTWPVRRKTAAFSAQTADCSGRSPISYTDFSYAGGYQSASELLDKDCTAIICGSDVMAVGAVAAAADRGLSVPRDLSVVGYDDIPTARTHSPAITTIRQPVALMARTALRHVLASEGRTRRAPSSAFAARPELVVRASTAAPR
ncbi:LacI family DNA-binding transcriptional regulator [Helcobacillus massiliensis]|uniref:DNA-binding LacI/PurR family transcriptional regulator n=1 Tax=Helcobacillus massiliensis TaxID=521392 RepID=A0A839QQW1_9MICO|nr:LacI family DNA-binding transcriptional regulator [Helcobacillus massiliensis]MBB3022704.1 DNA-binding LacI/PurR family transcriptional regulator [Helcobacillus massiliensis]